MFNQTQYISNEPESFDVTAIDYEDAEGNGTVQLRGYLALPENLESPTPLIVVFPDWDGVNTYEKKRATLLAELGYIAFAADIYGKDLQNMTDDNEKGAQVTKFVSDPTLYLQRMQRAIDVASETEFVDKENVGIIGYCFGGSGVVLYSRSGLDSAKVAIAFHGIFYQEEVPSLTDTIHPYTLM